MSIICTSLTVRTQPSPRFHVEAWLPFRNVKWAILQHVFCIFLSISIETSSACPFCRDLKITRFDFVEAIESLFARHHCVNFSFPEFIFHKDTLHLYEKRRYVYHRQRERNPRPLTQYTNSYIRKSKGPKITLAHHHPILNRPGTTSFQGYFFSFYRERKRTWERG